jgi:anti-anti-sigma factor
MESIRANQPTGSGTLPPIEVHWPRRGVAHVMLFGEHDLATAPALSEAITDAASAASCLLLDLTNAEFIDSATVQVLWEASRRAEDDGLHFVLIVAGRAIVGRVLELTGLLAELPVASSVAEALLATPLENPRRPLTSGGGRDGRT